MSSDDDADHDAAHDQPHGHSHRDGDGHHGHGHHHDRGIRGMLRYLRYAREMWRSEVNDAVVARLAPSTGERVADIGAGLGAGAVVAAAGGAHVVAVEPTGYMRTVLRVRRLGQRARRRIEVVEGAAEATGLDDHSVDALWAVNSMHHWTDPDAAVVELARVLRPGGRLLLVDEDFEDPEHPDFERFGQSLADHAHHFEMVDVERFAGGLRRAGLEVDLAGREVVAGAPAFVVGATVPLAPD